MVAFVRCSRLDHSSSIFVNQATKICALIIVAAWTSILAAQFSSMGSIVSQMSAISAIDALLLGSCVIVCYTILGGQSAVMKSDVI